MTRHTVKVPNHADATVGGTFAIDQRVGTILGREERDGQVYLDVDVPDTDPDEPALLGLPGALDTDTDTDTGEEPDGD
jgi:hypothetical protein